MKLKLILLLAIFVGMNAIYATAQSITIDECQEKAAANYPAIAQYDVIEQTKNYNIANANKAYLPQGSLNAQGTWQSDVTKIDLNVPGITIPSIDKDQYKIFAEVNQLIWDGGKISAQKKSVEAGSEVEKQQLTSEIYKLRERVNNLFFGILLMDRHLTLQEVWEKELQRNYNNVETYIQNGVANQADLSAVKVEQLKVSQQRIHLESTRDAYMKMLSVLIGEPIDENATFITPDPESAFASPIINRPELKLFQAQENAIESQRSLLKAKNLPVLAAFGQGGFGKPALNMFDNEFSPYFIGGLRLSWNFGNLYTFNNDKKKIELQKRAVDSQRDTFLHNLNMQIPQQQIEITKFRKTMQDDDEIIQLQKLIREAAEVKVENGTMSVSDLVKEISAEEAAKRAKTLHEIQYLMSIYSLKYTTN